MPDPTSSKAPAQAAPKKPAMMPVIDGLTPEKWKAAMSRKPDGVTKADWSLLTTTLFEIQAKRIVSPSQLAYAKKVATASKATPTMQKMLDDAGTQQLMLAATASGKQQIADQPALKIQRIDVVAARTASANAVAAKAAAPSAPSSPRVAARTPRAAAGAPARAAAHPTAAPAPAIAVKLPPGLPPDQASGYKHVVAAVRSGNVKGISYGKLNFAYEIADRAEDYPTRDGILGQMHKLRPLVTQPGKAGFRYGVTDAEYANYAKVEDAIKAGHGADVPQQNLVLAHKTAVKYKHTEHADVIAALLPAGAVAAAAVVAARAPAKRIPIVKVPGATPISAKEPPKVASLGPAPAGISEEEWKKAPPAPADVPASFWRTYLSTTYLLYNHGKVSPVEDLKRASGVSTKLKKDDFFEGQMLTALAEGDKAPVAELAQMRDYALQKHPKAATVLGERLIVAANKSGSPQDLKVAQAVAQQMGHTKTAAAIAAKVAPAAGAAAAATAVAVATTQKTRQGAPAPVASRPRQEGPAPRTSVATKGYTAADSQAVDDGMRKLDKYEQAALTNAAHKVATKQPLTLKELTDAQAAADKAGLNVPAAKFGKMASEVQARDQESRLASTSARIAARPTPVRVPPAVAAKVPATPPPVVVAEQSAKLGVPPQATHETIQTAKGSGPEAKEAQKNIADGTATAQAAADGNPAAQKKIADLQQAATQPGPDGIEAQKKLAGVAAGNSITVTVNTQAPAAPAASAPPSYAPPEGRGEALPPPLVSEGPRMRANAPQPVRYTPPARASAPPPPEAESEPEEAPPLPPPEHVAAVRTTPSTRLVKVAAAAAGVSAVAVGATILAAKKGDESAQNNMQSGAALAEGLENNDPTAQATLSQLKKESASGDPAAKAKLTGVAAAAATQKAIQEKAAKDKAAVMKEVRGQAVQASIAGPMPESNTGLVVGALAMALGGGYLMLKSKGSRKAA